MDRHIENNSLFHEPENSMSLKVWIMKHLTLIP